MAKRTYRTNTEKSKAAKERENFLISTDSATTNHYLNNNDKVMEYNYRKSYKDDYDYGPKIRKDRGYNYKNKEDSFLLDDYTSSAISYDEYIKRPRLNSLQSKNEYGQTRRHNNRDSYRHYSPLADYDYFKQGDSTNKWPKRTKSDEQSILYQFENELDKYRKNYRRSRSPRKRDDYEDYIHDEPEENYEVEKYFKKTRLREKKPKKYANEDKIGEDRKKNSKGNEYEKKENEEEFPHQETKINEKVFGSREKIQKKSSLNSEIEIGNIDYPMLAFKDNVSQDKSSDMVYLPVIVFDKKSKSQESPKHLTQSSQTGNIQVFATNLKDRPKGIFTFAENNKRNEQKLKSQAGSELQTEDSSLSRGTKFKENSTVRTSTETQTEESLIFEHNHPTFQCSNNTKSMGGSIFQKVEETQTDDSLFFEPNHSKPQSYKNAGSILGPINDREDFNSKLKDNHSPKETKRTIKYEPSIKNKKLFAYQIDVDIEPVKKSMFASTVTKTSPKNVTNQFKYKQIEDTLHDDYPVTKDYIKVSDSSLEQIKANMFTNYTLPSKTPSMSKIPINLISKNRQNDYATNYGNSSSENIYKPKTDNRIGYVENPLNLQSKNLQIFRSAINRAFKNSKMQSPPTKSSQIYDKSSMLSEENIRQSEYVPRPKQEGFQGEVDEGSDATKGRKSMARQRDSSLVGRKSQSIIRESRIEKPSSATYVNDYSNKYQTSNAQSFKKSRPSTFNERKQSKSILRNPFISRTEKPVESNNMNFQEKQNNSLSNIEPQDEKKSVGSNLVGRNSKAKKSVIRQSRMSGSEYESEPMRSRRKYFRSKSDEHTSNERKSETDPTEESEIKNKPSKRGFSKLFSRSNSKTGTGRDKKVKSLRKSMSQSKLSYPERDETQSEDNEISSMHSNTSQATLDKQKSIEPNSKINRMSQSKLQEKAPSQINKRKSKSKTWSFLRRSKTKDEPETESTGLTPYQQQDPESPSPTSSQVAVEEMQKPEQSDKHQKENQNENKEDKPCECVIKYVKQARDCSNFFLGTTLHEQIMDILKVI